MQKYPHNALKTDLYELTMAAGYFENKLDLQATFELFCHTIPQNRAYIVVCGLQQAIEYILNLKFNDEDIKFLKSLPAFKKVSSGFFDYLKRFRFKGDIWALPEGEFVFDREPILQVKAPIIEAQILETYLLSIYNIQSLIATKAARVVHAACSDGKTRSVVDFGSRRAHGPQAAVLAARAAYVGGCVGTSNVYASRKFGIPAYGTMAHSWIEAFNKEEEAFLQYGKTFPESTILLIDTYDTLKAARGLSKLKDKKNIKAVRLDSGDLNILSKKVRKILDGAEMKDVKIIASGNLNEFKILDLVKAKAPIDIFGVGTDMVVSRDVPALDLTYKLVETKDRKGNIQFKAKQSKGKETIPGRKQIFRKFDKKGVFKEDMVGLFSEKMPKGARPLLKQVIQGGKIKKSLPNIDNIKKYAKKRISFLPSSYLKLTAKRGKVVHFSRKILKTR